MYFVITVNEVSHHSCSRNIFRFFSEVCFFRFSHFDKQEVSIRRFFTTVRTKKIEQFERTVRAWK